MFNPTLRLLAAAAVALTLAACAPRDTGGTSATTGSGMSSPMPGMAMSTDADRV